jgi:hypothetical protein
MKMPCEFCMARMPAAGWNRTANQTMLPSFFTHQRSQSVFVRAVWRQKRLLAIKQTLRELDVPPTRNGGILGLASADFPKMTRGLFDRHP